MVEQLKSQGNGQGNFFRLSIDKTSLCEKGIENSGVWDNASGFDFISKCDAFKINISQDFADHHKQGKKFNNQEMRK